MRKLVVTGPESSGKSTLAAQLAEILDLPLANEYAREYLSTEPGAYSEEDLLKIAEGQLHSFEHITNESGSEWMICDTDLINIVVWQEEVFYSSSEELEELLNSSIGDHYFLCYPDLEWVEDPLRENPEWEDRITIFNLHLEKVEAFGIPYTVIRGSGDERIERALAELPF